jgi:hypothetical protein
LGKSTNVSLKNAVWHPKGWMIEGVGLVESAFGAAFEVLSERPAWSREIPAAPKVVATFATRRPMEIDRHCLKQP